MMMDKIFALVVLSTLTSVLLTLVQFLRLRHDQERVEKTPIFSVFSSQFHTQLDIALLIAICLLFIIGSIMYLLGFHR